MKWRWVPPRFDWLVFSAILCAGLLGLYAFETAAIHLGSSILAIMVIFVLWRIDARRRRLTHQLEERNQSLREERFLLETLMGHIPDHIYFKDRESRFLRVNQSLATLFKLKEPRQAIGKTDLDFFLAEHARQALADEQEIMRTGKPLVGREEKETWPDGSVTWVSTTKQALRDEKGEIIGTFGISRDITARRRAEEALAQTTQELLRSNQELEQFAYVASHDLQEPLRMIASYTQLLSRRYQGRLDAEADEFIKYAVDGATRLQVLINDLLAYSRVGTQGKSFALTECSEVLNRVLDNLKIAIDESAATVRHCVLPRVMADATQLTQLFQNLISNAIKFRHNRPPEIEISAERKKDPHPPPRMPPADVWLFSVRDNGIGIEPQYFDRIFIIFQRLHGRNDYEGTGIGLAICKKIVERHGGRIWVESAPGTGATFHFTIPEP